MPPPPIFSLIHNPEPSIAFLNFLLAAGQSKRIRIRFDDVVEITPDAAMALVAVLHEVPPRMIQGNVPQSLICKRMLMESGFFEHVRHGYKLPENTHGLISRRTSKQVEGALASEMISLGTSIVHGSSSPSEASYRVLVEAMQNTCNHANFARKGSRQFQELVEKRTWWSLVYADVARKRVCFAFLDIGVGIFGSAKLTTLRKVHKALRLTADSDILRDIMLGRLSSRTGLHYRGKGLPAMRELCQSGEVKDFTLLSNHAHAEVSLDVYRNLEQAFRGTLLYWEI